jgi:hypothetical protein
VKLSASAWRTLYNVADALQPPSENDVAFDLAPAVEAGLASAAEARALRRTLGWLELETRLLHAPTRGFSWLSREERRACLARWERSGLPWRRRGFARLAAVVSAALARGPQSLPGA